VYGVPAAGFWQVHPAAAATLVDAVTEALSPCPGDVLHDLYCGSGLFAGALAARVAPGGRVYGVESDAAAVAAARDNLLGVAGVEVVPGRVDEVLAGESLPAATVVVADPPRTGLGPAVVAAIAAGRPRRVAYVSCDPATLARDLATFGECGYRVVTLRAFDMFPMTHHLEALATLEPA
jgi:tRNA/tmRNA/rRNA uracil-C5-methylase (TrmA/RlmC/RlmD family)